MMAFDLTQRVLCQVFDRCDLPKLSKMVRLPIAFAKLMNFVNLEHRLLMTCQFSTTFQRKWALPIDLVISLYRDQILRLSVYKIEIMMNCKKIYWTNDIWKHFSIENGGMFVKLFFHPKFQYFGIFERGDIKQIKCLHRPYLSFFSNI